MSPSLTIANPPNSLTADVVSPCQCAITDTDSMVCAKLDDLWLREFGIGMGGSAQLAFWMCVGPVLLAPCDSFGVCACSMPVARCCSAFGCCIPIVVSTRACKQMFRSYTAAISQVADRIIDVARVADTGFVGRWRAVSDDIGEAMRPHGLAVEAEGTITIAGEGTYPKPAFSGCVNMRPKALHGVAAMIVAGSEAAGGRLPTAALTKTLGDGRMILHTEDSFRCVMPSVVSAMRGLLSMPSISQPGVQWRVVE